MSERSVPRPFELGCSLLDLSFEWQQDFEKRVQTLREAVKSKENYDIQGTWVRVDSEVSDAAIVAFPVRIHLYPERSETVDRAALEAMQKAKA